MSENYAPGRYAVNIISQELGETEKGTSQFILGFKPYRVENQNFAQDGTEQWPPCDQREQSAYFYLSEAAVMRSIKDLQQLGFNLPRPDFALLDQNTSGFVSLIGQDVTLECCHGNYEGKVTVRWRVPWASAKKPLEGDKLRNLNAMFGKHFVAQPLATPAPATSPTPASAPATPPSPADDIPM